MIVGLGNVGKEYENTRHNLGFMVLDSFHYDFSLESKFQAYIYLTTIESQKCIFVKPTTFMNLSGNAVLKIQRYYDISSQDIFVIHDDLDLPFGHFKIKSKGSSGGHNGIQSIIDSIGTNEFGHLKVGIGRDENIFTVDYVLGKFSKSNLDFLNNQYSFYQDIIYSFIKDGIQKTMSQFNGKDERV